MASNKTLKQRIALDGGKDIEAELKKLGAVGDAAFEALKKSIDDTTKAGTGFTGFITKLNKEMASLNKSSATLRTNLRDTGDQARVVARNVTLVTAAVTGAATAFFLFVKRAADVADAEGKAAQSTGLSIEQYGKLKFAFGQGNVDAEQFGAGMKKLNDNIADAAKGAGTGAKLFQQLGIKVKGANGQLIPTDEIIKQLAAKFKALPDGPQKSALAIDLFGKAGAKMIPVLNDGADAIQNLMDKAVAMGLVLTEEAARMGDDFGDSLDEITKTIGGISTQLGLLFVPAFTEVFRTINELLIDNKENILALGAAVRDQLVPFIKDFAALVGGDDGAVVNKNLIAVRDAFISIGTAAQLVVNIFQFLFDVVEAILDPFVQLLNFVLQFFGMKVSTKDVAIFVIVSALLGVFKLVGLAIKSTISLIEFLGLVFGKQIAGIIARVIGLIVGLGTLRVVVNRITDAIVAGFTGAGVAIQNVWQAVVDFVGGLFTGLGDLIKGVIDEVLGWLQGLLKMIADAAAGIAGIFGGGGGAPAAPGAGAPGHAAGGPIHGAGSGTSDSILSWLSNGEFVVKAAAVRKYGVGILSALNNMQLPGFAAGGSVSIPSMHAMPAFASGGPVGRPLSLTIGGETFEGLIAPETVAGKLVKYANGKSLRSAGRRPSWSK